MDRIGTIGGFEACFHVAGECVVQTQGVDAGARDPHGQRRGGRTRNPAERQTAAGGRVRAEALAPDAPAQGERIVAVPLDDVIAPFGRIRRALLLGGGGSLVLSGLLGAALSRSLTRPVRAARGGYGTGRRGRLP